MRWSQVCICMLGIVAFAVGCDDEQSPPPDDLAGYASPTAPESLIVNLQRSYRRGEIERYSEILAPEFIFRLQPIDQGTIGKLFLTHHEDSVGTRALFTTPEVVDIRIALLYSGRDSTDDKSPPADSIRIRILTTNLQVDQMDGLTWVVTDQQDMFFRKGIPANGENLTHWFLYQWDDLPSLASPKPATTLPTTWGKLKTQYTH